jgi:hypothetical protein
VTMHKIELISAARERAILEKLVNDMFTRFKLLHTEAFFVSDFILKKYHYSNTRVGCDTTKCVN